MTYSPRDGTYDGVPEEQYRAAWDREMELEREFLKQRDKEEEERRKCSKCKRITNGVLFEHMCSDCWEEGQIKDKKIAIKEVKEEEPKYKSSRRKWEFNYMHHEVRMSEDITETETRIVDNSYVNITASRWMKRPWGRLELNIGIPFTDIDDMITILTTVKKHLLEVEPAFTKKQILEKEEAQRKSLKDWQK